MHDRLHFGVSERPLESQNVAPKWPRSTQNDVQNGVCEISVDFGEKVPPPGALVTLQEASGAPKCIPRAAQWAPKTDQMRRQDPQNAPNIT